MSNFHIDQIRIDWGQMPVRLTFSYGAVSEFPFIVLRLGAGDFEGLGEVVVPSNSFFEIYLPTLLGADARRLDTLLPPTETDHDRILCEAVSMALYDLVAKASGLPLHVLLGGAASNTVPLMPCIFPANAAEAAEKASSFFVQGYLHLKTKLIGDLTEDLARVQAIRAVAPPGVVLQGDANEGYTSLSDARRAVAALGEAGLDIFEDPLKGGIEEYRELCRDNRGARVMIDALARRSDDLLAALKAGAAEVVGIHPDQAGSLSRVLRHVQLAKSFDVPVVVGGTGYTAVGTAVYQHLTAVATPDGPCGEIGGALDHGMPRSLVRQTLPMENGNVVLPDSPGCRVTVDEEAIAEFGRGALEWTL